MTVETFDYILVNIQPELKQAVFPFLEKLPAILIFLEILFLFLPTISLLRALIYDEGGQPSR